MANVLVNDLYLGDIADAIRSKLNVQTTYKPGEMAAAIESISGGSVNNQNKTVHPSSSDQSITADTGYTGLGTVSVKAVTMSNLSEANIVEGVTVKIGDADDDDRIASVTGSASGGITPTGTKTITSNGTNIDVYSYAKADVAVPNSYSAGDEGKVVSNGALVAQTSDTVTANNTYDTTLINSLTVNVSGGGGGSTLPKTGVITPEARTTSMTIDLGDSSISSVNGVVIAPTDSTPLLSGGKTCSVLLALPGLFYQSVVVASNNAGSGYVAPTLSTSDDRISISAGVITVTAPNDFEAISYTWYVW